MNTKSISNRIAGWLKQLVRKSVCIFASVCVLGFTAWSIGAIYHLSWLPSWLGVILAIAFVAALFVAYRRVENPNHWISLLAAASILVYLVTLTQQPSNDRNWVQQQSRLAQIDIDDGMVKVKNFRHSIYRSETDFDVRFHDTQFPLQELTGVWFVVEKFTALEGLAHTFVSFERTTENGPEYVAISVEIRREQGESYSPIRGLYRLFEIIYIIGDERDLIASRTVMRPSDRVYLYRVNATPKQVQDLFVDFAHSIKELEHKPSFYHTLLRNCTNEIVRHTYELTPEPINWLDPRIVLPGYSGSFAFDEGLVGSPGQSFEELQQLSRIDPVAQQVGLVDNFSLKIRQPQMNKDPSQKDLDQ